MKILKFLAPSLFLVGCSSMQPLPQNYSQFLSPEEFSTSLANASKPPLDDIKDSNTLADKNTSVTSLRYEKSRRTDNIGNDFSKYCNDTGGISKADSSGGISVVVCSKNELPTFTAFSTETQHYSQEYQTPFKYAHVMIVSNKGASADEHHEMQLKYFESFKKLVLEKSTKTDQVLKAALPPAVINAMSKSGAHN